ncbi:GLE1-like protein-domain-containing protein [Phlebopus sp. FC_14]|nr:GLE1-like protein-domain-containing protein [Phlebopus sp. FC_14]
MRFGLLRSPSPSPLRSYTRRDRRRSSTFGLPSDSDSDEGAAEGEEEEDESPSSSPSSDSFCLHSDVQSPPALSPPRPKRLPRSAAERRYMEETIAAIRLRARHYDPYEEWEKQTRKDALRTARREQTRTRKETDEHCAQNRARDLQLLASKQAEQMAEVQRALSALKVQQQAENNRLTALWKEQDRVRRERIEGVIRSEEQKHRLKLEAERKLKEEEERRRKEEEQRRKAEEERKRQEEEQKRRQKEAEEAEKREKEELERQRRAKLEAEEQSRQLLGMTLAEEDWVHAREALKNLKAGPMKAIKSEKALKSQWSAIRRQITPKIGQLTQDQATISRISRQIIDTIRPPVPLSQNLYFAALSSLAKAILLQAETEVTAEKRSAIPLAQVTANLLGTLDAFPDIFFAKLLQRAGGWPVPCTIPSTDSDGSKWTNRERTKAMGYRMTEGEKESPGDYVMRVSGMMRVYFLVLAAAPPLSGGSACSMFQLSRFWTYFTRIMNDERLLETEVAAQLLYTALDVGGLEARNIWGPQWVKLLEVLYEGAMVGIGGSSDKPLGGSTPEGKAACVRVQLEIERIIQAP